MPQMLHLQAGDELPFFVRGSKLPGQRSLCSKCNLVRVMRAKFLMVFLAFFVIFGFLYIQFYDFPRELNRAIQGEAFTHIDKKTRIKAQRHTSEVNVQNKNEGEKVISAPKMPTFSGPTNQRQSAVRDAFVHAWSAYKRYAWGYDQLKPLSKSFQEWMDCGLTIVDSLDTIIIMGLKDEYEEAKKWVEESLDFNKNRFVNLFETTIRVLGGLLSAFILTGENIFLEKSKDLGDRLIGALNSPSPIPYSDVNLKTKNGQQPGWIGDSSLSEITSIQLEFRALSRLIGDDSYEKRAFRISEHIHSLGCAQNEGLCGMFLSPKSGKFTPNTTITFGARSDSYYEYLLKQWLQLGKTQKWLIDDYKMAVDSMEKRLWRYSEPNNFGFIGELLQGKNFSPKMDHLACFMAGTLALGVQYGGMPDRHIEIAKNLSRTCFEFYNTQTGLAPEIAYFNLIPGVKQDLTIKPLDTHCLLRPEAFESWFYMYRITGDKRYQEWGWKAFQAIDEHARPPNGVGYASVNNVKRTPVSHRDLMESFFLSESLKYLYLLLADDQNILPLHDYVFNTEGHPLPIYAGS